MNSIHKPKNIIVRYNEIGLKGKNRGYFENLLIKNIKKFLSVNKVDFENIVKVRGRILIKLVKYNKQIEKLFFVFGISSFSPAYDVKLSIKNLKSFIKNNVSLFGIDKTTSFRISTQRIDKSIALKSTDVDVEIGKQIQELTNAKVNLKKYDKQIYIEIFNNSFYVFKEKINCFGGLPLGSEKSFYIINDASDSTDDYILRVFLSLWSFMKRGSIPVLNTINYDDKNNKEQAIKDFIKLFSYSNKNPEKTNSLVFPYFIDDIKKNQNIINKYLDKYENSVAFFPVACYNNKTIKEKIKFIQTKIRFNLF